MADDALSPAEMETLLSTTARGRKPTRDLHALAAHASSQRADLDPQPTCVSREQLRAVGAVHEEFARSFAPALSTMLRAEVEVKLVVLEQIAYGQFVRGLENPTFFNVLRAAPLAGAWGLDVNPSILLPLLDRLLGGGHDASPVQSRPLTEIELCLAARVTGLAVEALRTCWQPIAELEISVARVETDRQKARIAPQAEAVVQLGFEIALRQARGRMSLCLPAEAARSVAARVSSTAQRPIRPDELPRPDDHSQTVELVVELAETSIASNDILNLRPGDILTTEQRVGSPLVVRVDGVPRFRARPGAFDGHKAVQIDDALDPPPAAGT